MRTLQLLITLIFSTLRIMRNVLKFIRIEPCVNHAKLKTEQSLYLDRSFGLAKGSAKSLHFLAKYALRPYFRSANWLSESLSQKVKSPSV